jgi:hypothetical protein
VLVLVLVIHAAVAVVLVVLHLSASGAKDAGDAHGRNLRFMNARYARGCTLCRNTVLVQRSAQSLNQNPDSGPYPLRSDASKPLISIHQSGFVSIGSRQSLIRTGSAMVFARSTARNCSCAVPAAGESVAAPRGWSDSSDSAFSGERNRLKL